MSKDDIHEKAQQLRGLNAENAVLRLEVDALTSIGEVLALMPARPARQPGTVDGIRRGLGELMTMHGGAMADTISRLMDLFDAEWGEEMPAGATDGVAALRALASAIRDGSFKASAAR